MANIKKCKGCGQNLEFDPKSQSLTCHSCGSGENFDTKVYENNKRILDLKYKEVLTGNANLDCPNCGAKDCVDRSSTAISLKCMYCHTPLVASNEVYDIDAVIPFKLDKAEAKTSFLAWTKRRFWAPAGLKKVAKLDNFKGYYIPSWAFDTAVHTDYKGVEVRSHTHRNSNGTSTVTYTYHPFSGRLDNDFKDIIVAGNDYIADSRLQKLEPYDYRELKVFSDEYFYGFSSDSFNSTIENGWMLARAEMDAVIRNQITRRYETVQDLTMNQSYKDSKFARFMVPVWKANYKYKTNQYNVYINGQTGKVSGDSPVAKWKVVLAVLFGLAVAGVIAYFMIFG